MLIDTRPLGRNPDAYTVSVACPSRWWAALAPLGPLAVLGSGTTVFKDVPRVNNWPEAVRLAHALNLDRILVAEADQFFLDANVASHALSRYSKHWDYFTQWEHSRLPVGVGARLFNLISSEVAEWCLGWQELVRHIQTSNGRFRVCYDDENHGSHRLSFLDSRFRLQRIKDFERYGAQGFWGLKGFVQAMNTDGAEAFSRGADIAANGCMDHRRLPAAYGFESAACAAFPTYIMFDITNVCNSRCIHCPHSTVFYGKKHRPTHMAVKTFTGVVDQCTGRELEFVRVTADGEPLLHPGLEKMLAYATARKVGPVGLTSNGMLMNEDMARRILDTGVFLVDFSLDAVRAETYAKIRRGLDFTEVVRNVERFTELRDKHRYGCKVMVSFVKQDANRRELDAFQARWQDVVDKVLVRSLLSNVNLVDTGAVVSQSDRHPCPHPFRRLVITYDGDYKYCPVDWENRTRVGSVTESSVAEIWHGEGYRQARLEQLNLSFPAQRACCDCTDWRGTPWKLGYEKMVHELDAFRQGPCS